MTRRHASSSGGRALDRIGWVLLGLLLVAIVVGVVFGGRDTYRPDAEAKQPPAEQKIPLPPTFAPAIGMYVDSHVSATGDVQVAHWIRSRSPITELRLTAADPDGLPGGVVARRVKVVGDGVVLSSRRTITTKQQKLVLKQPATSVYVTYTLSGGVDATGTVTGRVLARSVALDVDYDQETGPVTRHVAGDGSVLNVACLLRDDSDSTPRPCGRSLEDGWLVELRGANRDDRLLAQLEMTTASASGAAAPAP